jgi:dihydroorotate dehydrogenase electron transfer subunit
MGLKPYRVTSNFRRGSYTTLTLEGEVEPSQPGQFYMLRGDWGADPLLGRPLSILGEDPKKGTLRFLLKVVGEGTRRLHALQPGERVYGLGPLGRAFPIPALRGKPSVLVGGGVGVPPLVNLAKRFVEHGFPFCFLQGARTREDLLLLDELSELGVKPVLTTEDGSEGIKGLVTAPLEKELASSQAVYACGPEGMLKAVAAMCRGKLSCHLSLEARMGCGYGVCLGCVVAVEKNGKRIYERVCQEGPVFDGEAVLWA